MSHNLTERQMRARTERFAPGFLLKEEDAAALDIHWARLAVQIFNARIAAGRVTVLWPTVGAALASKHHWLQVYCRGCRTVKAVDLRVVPRPTILPIVSILSSLRRRVCRGQNPLPVIIKLSTTF